MTFKERVRNLVGEESRAGRIFNLFIKVLILLSVVSISVETLPERDEQLMRLLGWFELFVISVFTIEYMARIYAAENRLKFIFSLYGIIDLLAIFPYYLATGMDLRSLRVLRVLRLARILKFTRYTDALDRMGRAFWLIRNELVMFFVITFCFLYISALGIYYFENPVQPDEFKSVFHSLWWSVITITQVGYGDVYPITAGGRLFTFGVLLIGLMMMAVPTGLIASALTKTIGDE